MSELPRITICSYGAAGTVTGSRHVFSFIDDDYNLLLDCGMFQGYREEKEFGHENFELPFDVNRINGVLLSHAHIDHSGSIPLLVKSGYRGAIYTPPATPDIAEFLLLDSANIQKNDYERMMRKYRERRTDKKPRDPPYDAFDVADAMKQFATLDYNEKVWLEKGLSLEFKPAGHVLGAGISVIEKHLGDSVFRIVYTGDIGPDNRPLIRNAENVSDVDVLITEGTYGGRYHEREEDSQEKLEDIINTTISKGGNVLIPAFSFGRTQELMLMLYAAVKSKKIPEDIKIYMDSPLAQEITMAYVNHDEMFNENFEEFKKRFDVKSFGEIVTLPNFVYPDKDISREVASEKGACVVASSGMCKGGRIMNHLKYNIGDFNSAVVFSGYLVKGSPGRNIMDKRNGGKVRIDGLEYRVNASVDRLNTMSAHRDHDGLLEFILNSNAKKVLIVHSEPECATALKNGLIEKGFNPNDVTALEKGVEYQLL